MSYNYIGVGIMELIKRIFKDQIISSIIIILMGLILLVFPIESISFASLIIAGILCVGCLANIVYFFIDNNVKVKMDTIYFVLCLLGLALGIYTFINPTWLIATLNVIVGLLLIISAVINIRYLLKYSIKNTLWWIFMGVNAIILILGVIAIINPIEVASTITRLEGISLILDGIMSLLIVKKYAIALK